MDTPNPSRQRKNAAKKIARQGRSNKGYGGKSNKDGGVGALRARFFGGSYAQISIPSRETTHHRENKKSNRNRLSVKAKHKKRLKKNG